jgi:hypothetical protein
MTTGQAIYEELLINNPRVREINRQVAELKAQSDAISTIFRAGNEEQWALHCQMQALRIEESAIVAAEVQRRTAGFR